MKLSSRAHNLFQAFEESGCPVCRLTAESVHHYLESLMYEYANDPQTHLAVRAARGFCATHAHHTKETIRASGIGIAVLYEGLISTLLKEMGEVTPDSGWLQVNRAENALKPEGACPACEHRDTVEDHLLRNLLEYIEEDEFAAGFEQSAGLCLPHLQMALDGSGRTSAKARLIAIQQRLWSRLQGELAEFLRKHDYRYADEALGAEGDSPRRAIEQMSGKKGLR